MMADADKIALSRAKRRLSRRRAMRELRALLSRL